MFALIKNNVIENIIVLDTPADYTPPDGFELVEISEGGIGWGYIGGVVTQPVPIAIIIPTSITMRQCRLQLLADGVYETVNSAVASMGQAAGIEWEYAMDVDRTNPLVPSMQQLLGWTDARVDQFYTEAAKR
jgi:hypothetical protein